MHWQHEPYIDVLNKSKLLNLHPYLWQDANCFDIPVRNHENYRGS